MKILSILLGAIVGLSAIGVSAATAHEVYEQDWTYQSGATCTLGRASIADSFVTVRGDTIDGPAGLQKVGVYPKEKSSFSGINCSTASYVSANRLAVRSKVYKWSGSAWQVCRDTQWLFNSSTESRFEDEANFVAQCGHGYYGNNGAAYRKNGSSWEGGWIWSGYHANLGWE